MLEVNFTCVIFILSFIPFVFFLNQTLWKPISRIKAERDLDISQELNQADRAERETKEISTKVKQELEALRKEEQMSFNKALQEFSQQKIKEEEKLKVEFAQLKERTFHTINSQRDSLLSSSEAMSGDIAETLLQKLTAAQTVKSSRVKEAVKS
jgi:F0F1-type ATP synthase membrane subunit b/b'